MYYITAVSLQGFENNGCHISIQAVDKFHSEILYEARKDAKKRASLEKLQMTDEDWNEVRLIASILRVR